jgi:cell division ATPase FtsA
MEKEKVAVLDIGTTKIVAMIAKMSMVNWKF